jgi:dihydroorotase
MKPLLKILIAFFLLGTETLHAQPADILYAATTPGHDSKGIYVLKFDRKTAKLTVLQTVTGKRNPNFLAVDPSGKYLYVICGEGITPDDKTGSVLTFAIDPQTGLIQKIDQQSTEGRGPAHVSVDPKGRYAYVANYGQGNFAIYRIKADGSLGKAEQVLQYTGSGFDTALQKAPFVHSVIPSADGKFIYASSLGLDRIMIYQVSDTGAFLPAKTPFASSTPGAGPRHFVIHPNGRFAWSVEEIGSSVAAYDRDPTSGALTPKERFKMVPAEHKGNTSGADIHLSPDGRFLYASIRDLDKIAVYSVNQKTGKLTPLALEDTHGDHPRNFCIDKSGDFIFVENMLSDNIAIFKRDRKTGRMTYLSDETIPRVACLVQWNQKATATSATATTTPQAMPSATPPATPPATTPPAREQAYDLLIRNGHLIDTKNHIDAIMDIAVKDGKVAKVATNIAPDEAKKLIDATGMYVSPGFIDMHTHVFVGSKASTFADGFSSLSPDDFTFRSGVTTVVDAGTSGWRNFPLFKEHVIDQSKTRVLAFLNIAGDGMSGDPGQEDINDMNAELTSLMIKKYPAIIVGVKIGHYSGSDWAPFDRALEAATTSNTTLFVECHLPKYSLQDQLARMRPGDIMTHAYEKISERAPITDSNGNLLPCVLAAQKRGILFDVGHGGAGFWFSVARPAVKQGLLPNSFGTDLHRFSMNSGMKNMSNVMSKFLNMGMGLPDVINRATWSAARSIKREDLGQLSEGAVADITVFSLLHGKFGFIDAEGSKMEGDRKIETELTIREGKVVYDLNGIAAKTN